MYRPVHAGLVCNSKAVIPRHNCIAYCNACQMDSMVIMGECGWYAYQVLLCLTVEHSSI
jgi:hypothetical protein